MANRTNTAERNTSAGLLYLQTCRSRTRAGLAHSEICGSRTPVAADPKREEHTLKNAYNRKSATAEEPLLVGSGSRTGHGDNGPGSFCELEIRIKLTPTQARLLQHLPIVGDCVRHNRVPLAAGKWCPHPTAPGVDIQFGAA